MMRVPALRVRDGQPSHELRQIAVAVRPHDWSEEFAYDDRIVKLKFHRCSILKGVPKSQEGQEFRWITPAELAQYTFPPANARVVQQLTQARFVDPHATGKRMM